MSDASPVAFIRERLASGRPTLICVAGPNGAGKTTFVQKYLEPLPMRFVNADNIAKALFPAAPGDVAYEAAQLADRVRQDLVARRITFCMETVFSDREGSKIAFLREARSVGYFVFLVFIGVDSSDLSVLRVIHRTERGGHDVPEEKIVERFPRSLRNLVEAMKFVDVTYIYDNSLAEHPHRFVAELHSGRVVRIGKTQPEWWTDIAP